MRLYRLGGRGRWLRANLADFLVSGGGGRFNISYHVVVERAQADQALLSVHGIDQTLRTRYDPHEVFGPVLTDLSSHFRDVAISQWFDSRNLPAHLASSPAGFAQMVGPGRAFWWQ
ncbi:hypothetical protein SAMN06309945_0197 [Okibacterium fritillariae]|uniref:Uncharacterized protein n=1 Tax=Okibacterium fritillariae TaxID=123320 RepID=A0A1T5IBT2_9MICO|nr:hypothetical protein SAMN06309945_0197 [Okibacterium fritillariae]